MIDLTESETVSVLWLQSQGRLALRQLAVPLAVLEAWIFIPAGFDKTLGEMTEEEVLSLSSRRRAMIEFMRFLQANYDFK